MVFVDLYELAATPRRRNQRGGRARGGFSRRVDLRVTLVRKFLDDARSRAILAWKRLPARLRRLEPKSRLEWVGSAAVLWIFCAWFISWYRGNYDVIWDPMLQPDDARTALFPFHRYDTGSPLADDPIANEMLEYQPYAHRLLFRLTVPFVGLLAATKIVQALLFFVIALGGIVLATSRRAGLGAGLLFTFLFIHDISVQERVLGGLPRGFGFPVCALWLAGALAARPWVRYAAAIVAALTYPTGLAMVLGAEGVYAVRRFARPGWATLFAAAAPLRDSRCGLRPLARARARVRHVGRRSHSHARGSASRPGLQQERTAPNSSVRGAEQGVRRSVARDVPSARYVACAGAHVRDRAARGGGPDCARHAPPALRPLASSARRRRRSWRS